MGQINLIHDESWRAARLVVNHFEPLGDAELVEAFHTIRGIIAESIRRSFERSERERQRLGKTIPSETGND